MSHAMKNLLIVFLSSFLLISWALSEKNEKVLKRPVENTLAIGPCEKLDQLYSDYINEANERITETELASKSMVPIMPEIGETYIKAHKYKKRPGRTQFVTMDIRTIAFFYKYMYENERDSISFCFARYKKNALRKGLEDPMFELYPEKNKRGTLVVGDFYGGTFHPFKVEFSDKSGIKTFKSFYDDWNQEWP